MNSLVRIYKFVPFIYLVANEKVAVGGAVTCEVSFKIHPQTMI